MWMKDRFGGEFEVVLSPQRNSMSFLKDRLWKERPLGLKTIKSPNNRLPHFSSDFHLNFNKVNQHTGGTKVRYFLLVQKQSQLAS